MHTILYTTDFSDSSKVAFPLAYSLARDHGARLIVLHVLPTGTYEIANLALLGQGESAQQFEDDIRHDLQRIQPPDDRVPMEYKLAEGDPAASIIQVAEETACDLIVLAIRRPGAFGSPGTHPGIPRCRRGKGAGKDHRPDQ
jgi:nucleotide-binding universal stress UspA family protein